MITLIGSRCKAGNRFSRGVLIPRFLLGNLKIALIRNNKKLLYPVIWNKFHNCLLFEKSKTVK